MRHADASVLMRPILVTGMPRSGTTWVGKMLCAGGGAGYIEEPFNLARPPGTVRVPVDYWYPYVTAANEHQFWPVLKRMLDFKYPIVRELARCRTPTDLRHTRKMWRSYAASRGRRPLLKEPHAIFSAEWFARRLESDIVITVRHPAAVVSSWKRLDWSFDFTNLIRQPALVLDRLGPFEREMKEALEPSHDLVDRVALLWRVLYSVVGEYQRRFPDFHVVRQEDLSRDPLGGYTRLYEQVGLPFTPGAADAIAATSGPQNPKGTCTASPHDIRLDSRANLESWKQRLSSEEILRIRRVTEDAALLWYTASEWT